MAATTVPGYTSPAQAAYLRAMAAWANGERMVPEAFVGGLNNVVSHLAHWQDMANLLREGERLLEIGCGSGFPARVYSLRTRCEVVAVDKPEVIAISAVAYPTPGVRFVGHDLNEPFDFGYFDAVIAVDVLEHIADLDTLLKNLSLCDTGNTRWQLCVPVGDCSPNDWHLQHWETREAFLSVVGRYLPIERIVCL